MAANGASKLKSYPGKKNSSPKSNQQVGSYIGDWLCQKGPYQEYIEALSESNPGLKKRDPANEATPLRVGNATVTLLEAPTTGPISFTKHEFVSSAKLQQHFDNSERNHDRKRIYVMEGLATDYIKTIGGEFFMDPSFFLRQERTCVWSNSVTPTSDALPPPTALNPRKMFHLQYCELRHFNKFLPNLPHYCSRTNRHIGMTAGRKNDKTTVAILRRKIAWWSQETQRGGWDVVILCDPELRELLVEREEKREKVDEITTDGLKSTAFQGGYVDFVALPNPGCASSMPKHPRHSMLKDLCYYFENHSSLIRDRDWAEPDASSIFLKKIVVAHYLQLIDYIKAMLPSLELRLTTGWEQEQEQWKSLQTTSRRCGNFGDDVEECLLSLGYPLEDFKNNTRPDWKDCQIDFQYIYFRLRILKQRADTVMQSMTGLASIAGNRQNLDEAKRVKRLNLLALLFIPLAYTSSLFSMQDNYAPGNGQFWVYWVSALTVVALTLSVTWILDNYAIDEAAQWRLGPLKRLGENIRKVKRTKTIYD